MSIHKRQTSRGVRYDVRLRDPSGRVRTKTMRTRRDAETYERQQLTKRDRGEWTDPRDAAMPFDEWARTWLDLNPAKRPKTLAHDRGIVERHLVPAFGARRLGAIRQDDVQRLVHTWAQRYKPNTARGYYSVLRAILAAAVEADLIGRSPCRAIKLPMVERCDRHQLTPAEIRELADAVPTRHRVLILLAAETSMRFAECAGLRVGRLSLMGSTPTLTVAENAVETRGRLYFGPPKSSAGYRTIALSAAMRDALAGHLAEMRLTAADSDKLVFTAPSGEPLRYSNFRARVWTSALRAVGLDGLGLGFHDLRRSAATRMVAGLVDVRTAQHRLGHSDPRLTLSVYAQVTDGGDRAAAEALGAGLFGMAPDQLPPLSAAATYARG